MTSRKEKAMHVIGYDTSAENLLRERQGAKTDGGVRTIQREQCFHSPEKGIEGVLRNRERARKGRRLPLQ